MSPPPSASPLPAAACGRPHAWRRASFVAAAAAGMLSLILASCSSGRFALLSNAASEAVVYALGPRDGYASPLNGSLKTACPALTFGDDDFELSTAHEQAIHAVYASIKDDKKARLLIAGYAPPELPADHARSLSERRAQAVRQRLVELGADPASIQTVGYGNDFSFTGPSSGVVVIYRE